MNGDMCNERERKSLIYTEGLIRFYKERRFEGMEVCVVIKVKSDNSLSSQQFSKFILLVMEKEYSEFKPVKPRLKIDLVSYPTRAEGLVNSILLVM